MRSNLTHFEYELFTNTPRHNGGEVLPFVACLISNGLVYCMHAISFADKRLCIFENEYRNPSKCQNECIREKESI